EPADVVSARRPGEAFSWGPAVLRLSPIRRTAQVEIDTRRSTTVVEWRFGRRRRSGATNQGDDDQGGGTDDGMATGLDAARLGDRGVPHRRVRGRGAGVAGDAGAGRRGHAGGRSARRKDDRHPTRPFTGGGWSPLARRMG